MDSRVNLSDLRTNVSGLIDLASRYIEKREEEGSIPVGEIPDALVRELEYLLTELDRIRTDGFRSE